MTTEFEIGDTVRRATHGQAAGYRPVGTVTHPGPRGIPGRVYVAWPAWRLGNRSDRAFTYNYAPAELELVETIVEVPS